MDLYVLAKKYPNGIDVNPYYFVQQLVWTLADKGVKVRVICPVAANKNLRYLSLPFKTEEKTENGSVVPVYRPRFFSFGEKSGRAMRLTAERYTRACRETVKSLGAPDAFYGHFTIPCGYASASLGKESGVPAFFAYGEPCADELYRFGADTLRESLAGIAGVVAVSAKSKRELAETGAVPEEKVRVFPNGVRTERFYPRDKKEARRRFGFPADAFIVSFTGAFHTRKGARRLEKAVELLPGVYAAYAGRGSKKPGGPATLWAGPVENSDMPLFLSASDVFVLPTLNEGCSNSVIEAMACGIPVISSDREFNDDILDESCSLRVDPESPREIAEAIRLLKNDAALRQRLAEGSLARAGDLTLEKRAEKIVSFIEECLR
ncbi:MAG: glycosyltransferase family 4 protein [Abditibacteriota bacterium]|nr:glycosyltransferase family 4 protein [Abditibacteriota bacterium]